MKKILITGANGQLGSELKNIEKLFSKKGFTCLFTDKKELDITNFQKVKEFCKNNNINLIINTAAYTAVDQAENEKEIADLINNKAVENLVNLSQEEDIYLIHISSDYVFDGKNYKPYKENDKINPINFYGLTKAKSEESFLKSRAKGIIIRTSWVYSNYGNNFVKTIKKLAKKNKELNIVFDQIGTPTYAKDLAKVIFLIIKNLKYHYKEKVEIYHYSNEGVASWYDFAKEIIEILQIDCKINPIESKDFPTVAKRPHFSVLNKFKIKNDFSIIIPHWKESLKKFLGLKN